MATGPLSQGVGGLNRIPVVILGRRNEPFNSNEGRASNLLKHLILIWIVVLRQIMIPLYGIEIFYTVESLILAQDER